MPKSNKPKPSRIIPNSPIANIKVIGVGGGGGNAVARMSKDFIRGVDFVAINTDHQDLDNCDVRHKIYIGRNLTKGLGTGMNPEIGRQAAEENRSEIAEAISGADLVFIAAGMGGGTGSGVSPVVAEVAKQSGALTLAFVTKPFAFEGTQRQRIAEEAIQKLKDKVDALIVVPNDRIFTIISKDTPIMKAFEAIDDVLKSALSGLAEMIITPGIINVDFADVRAVIQDGGPSIVGIGMATGNDRSVAAVNQALHSPLLEISPDGAKSVLLGISGGRDMKMNEINEAAKIVAQTVDPGAKIIFGAYYDKHLKPNQLKVTVIATGFSSSGNTLPLFGGGSTGMFESPKPNFFNPKNEERLRSSVNEDKLSVKVDDKSPYMSPVESDKEKLMKAAPPQPAAQNGKKEPVDVWDIPTFLRRKRK